MEQKDYVSKALPAGMGSLLGFTDLLVGNSGTISTTLRSNTNTKKEIPTTAPSVGESSNLLKWLLPIFVGAGLIFYVTKDGCNKTVDETITSTEDSLIDGAPSTTEVEEVTDNSLQSAFMEVDESAKALFDALTIEVGTAPDQIIKYVQGGYTGTPLFSFNNVNFAVGSAKLSAESQVEADNLAALMKVYPNINFEIQGHTDNAGDADANLKLSEARAIAIMMRLVGKGNIAQDRLTAKGFGQTEPIASNNSEEGRAQNRRIELKISN
jgi:outer membrane protein OmpA-like peptidoglycan-associated protein